MGYRNYFGFHKEPFAQDLRVEDLYPLPGLKAATARFHYALKLGAVSIVTGDVGSGKSTALRYAASTLHPSQYKVISLVGSTGSIIDVLRQLCNGFDVDGNSNSLARLTRTLRGAIQDLVQRKQTLYSSSMRLPCSGWRYSPNCTRSASSTWIQTPCCRSFRRDRTISLMSSCSMSPAPLPHG